MSKNTTNKYGDTIGTIRINGIPFNHLSPDSVLGFDTLSWTEEPTRNNEFAFENIDQIDIGLVSQCSINLKYCSIEDFEKLRQISQQRYVYITFYNVDKCEWEYDKEMYCSKSEKQKLFYFNPNLIGVIDVSITFVATNNDVNRLPLTVSFNSNGYNIVLPSAKIIPYGGVFKLEDAPHVAGYDFKYWTDCVDENNNAIGWRYLAGQSFTVWKDKILYPIYEVSL